MSQICCLVVKGAIVGPPVASSSVPEDAVTAGVGGTATAVTAGVSGTPTIVTARSTP